MVLSHCFHHADFSTKRKLLSRHSICNCGCFSSKKSLFCRKPAFLWSSIAHDWVEPLKPNLAHTIFWCLPVGSCKSDSCIPAGAKVAKMTLVHLVVKNLKHKRLRKWNFASTLPRCLGISSHVSYSPGSHFYHQLQELLELPSYLGQFFDRPALVGGTYWPYNTPWRILIDRWFD